MALTLMLNEVPGKLWLRDRTGPLLGLQPLLVGVGIVLRECTHPTLGGAKEGGRDL